jgi:hypothetical protein
MAGWQMPQVRIDRSDASRIRNEAMMEPTQRQAAARTLLQDALIKELLDEYEKNEVDAAVNAVAGAEYPRNEALANVRAIRRLRDALEIAANSGTREERPSSRAPA